jgi:hypothetical protein
MEARGASRLRERRYELRHGASSDRFAADLKRHQSQRDAIGSAGASPREFSDHGSFGEEVAGSSPCRNAAGSTPSAAESTSRVDTRGSCWPRSIRAITDLDISHAAASSSCEYPRSWRSRRTLAARDNRTWRAFLAVGISLSPITVCVSATSGRSAHMTAVSPLAKQVLMPPFVRKSWRTRTVLDRRTR